MDDAEPVEAAGAEVLRAGAAAALGRERRMTAGRMTAGRMTAGRMTAGRMTAGRKRCAVLGLLRGEPLELVARELWVTAADLGAWHDAPLGGRRGEPEEAGARRPRRPRRPRREDRAAPVEARRGPDGRRAALHEGGAAEGRRPFGGADACAMSAVVSISACRRHGVARVCRVCRVWGVARSGVCRLRRADDAPPSPRRRPGPLGPMPDGALVEAIRRVLIDSPFHGPRAPERSGRGCAMRDCAPPRSACAA